MSSLYKNHPNGLLNLEAVYLNVSFMASGLLSSKASNDKKLTVDK